MSPSFDEVEKIILKLPHKYLIFLDEVGDSFLHMQEKTYNNPAIFPVMTVTAVIVSKVAYSKILMPGLDTMKEKFFKSKNIYFHSREIRRKDGIFKIFLDNKKYSEFKKLYDKLIEKISLTIISSSINKIKFFKKAALFHIKSGQKYNIGDIYLKNVEYVLERVGYFLNRNTGKIIFEKRGKKESKRIQAVLTQVKQNGTFYYKKDLFKMIDNEILFFEKKDNINGLQVADYCTYPFARHAKNPIDKNNNFFDFLRKFIYSGKYGEFGLKEWP